MEPKNNVSSLFNIALCAWAGSLAWGKVLGNWSFGFLVLVSLFTIAINFKKLKLTRLIWGIFGFFGAFSILALLADNHSGYFEIEKKLPFLFCIPVLLAGKIHKPNFKWVFRIYIISFASLFFILLAFAFQSGISNSFYYHSFSSLLHWHAVYLSFYILAGIVLINNTLFNRYLKWFFSLIFYITLILLSSKMALICAFIWLIYYLFYVYKINLYETLFLGIAFISLFVSLCGPAVNRFSEIQISQLKYVLITNDPGSDFEYDGLTLRATLWKFSKEIWVEKNASLFGVFPGNEQKLLDKKITDANFYTGVKGTSDIGYLGYNCHNQFVQILLQGGIFLMLIFIFLIWSIFKESVFFKPILIFLLLFMLSESVLQTQAGMMLFVFAILISTLYHPEGKHANP